MDFPTDFEEFPMLTLPKGTSGFIDGYITVSATRDDWELGDVFINVGPNGKYTEKAPPELAQRIRDYFYARPLWRDRVDDEHRDHYSAEAVEDRRHLPSWMTEGV